MENKRAEQNEIEGHAIYTGEANSTLRALFVTAINGLYAAEGELGKAIFVLEHAASDADLQDEFERHLKQTNEHVHRMDQILEILNEKYQEENSDVMEVFIKEIEKIIANTQTGSSTRDTGLIMAAQNIQHYQIATYGSLVQIADTLQADEIVQLLKITLDEKKQADKNLSELAQSRINHISVAEMK